MYLSIIHRDMMTKKIMGELLPLRWFSHFFMSQNWPRAKLNSFWGMKIADSSFLDIWCLYVMYFRIFKTYGDNSLHFWDKKINDSLRMELLLIKPVLIERGSFTQWALIVETLELEYTRNGISIWNKPYIKRNCLLYMGSFTQKE